MRVCFYTLGCKVNLNETGALEQMFRGLEALRRGCRGRRPGGRHLPASGLLRRGPERLHVLLGRQAGRGSAPGGRLAASGGRGAMPVLGGLAARAAFRGLVPAGSGRFWAPFPGLGAPKPPRTARQAAKAGPLRAETAQNRARHPQAAPSAWRLPFPQTPCKRESLQAKGAALRFRGRRGPSVRPRAICRLTVPKLKILRKWYR